MTDGVPTKLRVLIVDDDSMMLRLLARYVTNGGYDVVTASNGREAMAKVREEGIPIVVTDWHMPDMDGLDLCRALRTQEGIDASYVILITSRPVTDDVLVTAFDAGIDDFLAKPIRSRELLVRIRAGSRVVRLQQDLERRNRETHRVNAELAIAKEKLEAANDRLRYVATTDELTGLTNRRAAISALQKAWADHESLACVMIDIDHFKSFNDAYGHATGDVVLKEVAGVLKQKAHPGQVCCRFGGEEFLVICPGESEDVATYLAGQMREAVEQNRMNCGDSMLSVTISAGVAQRLPAMANMDELVSAADNALYVAKDQGRNAVVPWAAIKAATKDRDKWGAAVGGYDEYDRLIPSHDTRPATVLVVDDDDASRVLCRRFLEQAGHTVFEAVDGLEALDCMTTCMPDVVVMDVQMPRMGGLECTQRLADDPVTSRVPVIIASGRADATDAAAAHQAGAAEFIAKPIDAKELLLRVATVARMKHEMDSGSELRGERARSLDMLLEFTRCVAGTESLACILSSTVDAFAQLTSCRQVSVLLPDSTGASLKVAEAKGMDAQRIERIRVPVGAKISGAVYQTGNTLVADSVDRLAIEGATDAEFFVSAPLASKPLRAAEHIVGVINLSDRCGSQSFTDVELEFMDLMCNVAATAIHACMTQQARDRAHESIVIALATLAEYRDDDTGKHLDRVTQYSVTLAERLMADGKFSVELDREFIADLRRAVPLHDIGKVGVPDQVLLKPGRLSEQEIDIIQTHTEIGANAILSVSERSPGVGFLQMAEMIARSHHEWFDGSGYPNALSGSTIPLAARITSVADVYDALTSQRVYKQAMTHENAYSLIEKQSGKQFDPEIIQAFDSCQKRFMELAEELRDDSASPIAEPVADHDVATGIQARDRNVQVSSLTD